MDFALMKNIMQEEIFSKYFLQIEPDDEVFCPYRICPIGAHVDHQFGNVSGFAINEGIKLYYKATEKPFIELYSYNFEDRILIGVKPGFQNKNNWGDYVKAAVNVLFYQGYKLENGFYGVVVGTLPIGGLASSSAVILSYLVVLSRVNRICLNRKELIKMAHMAESQFLNLNVGKLDQSCEIYCKQNCLLYLDTLNNYMNNIIKSGKMPSFRVGIFYSGISRTLRNSMYNTRVSECKAAARALKDFAGVSQGAESGDYLREIPKEMFENYKKYLPDNLRKRAEHYFSEESRLEQGISAWKMGDIYGFGKLIFESGDSSIENYESGSPELCKLHSIAKNTPGIWGGRFSGAGFKGCYMAIVDSRHTEQVKEYVTTKYMDAFPELKKSFSIHYCDIANGMKII